MNEQTSIFDIAAGEAARDRGIQRVWENAGDEWRNAALTAIATLAKGTEPFTAEDVRELCGDPPHFNAMGAAIRTAALRGWIRKVGFTKGRRPSLHASDLALWQGNRVAVRTIHVNGDFL